MFDPGKQPVAGTDDHDVEKGTGRLVTNRGTLGKKIQVVPTEVERIIFRLG